MLTDLYLTKSIVLLRFITNIITLERNGILILMLNLQVQNIIIFLCVNVIAKHCVPLN